MSVLHNNTQNNAQIFQYYTITHKYFSITQQHTNISVLNNTHNNTNMSILHNTHNNTKYVGITQHT